MSLLPLFLLIVYGGVAWKFWQVFPNTHFNRNLSNRIKLSLLWPVFLVISRNYRQNFQRALKGD